MNRQIKLLDVVALTEDLAGRKLRRGQVGTVVQVVTPGVFEVEFTDNDGGAFASLALTSTQLMIPYYQRLKAA